MLEFDRTQYQHEKREFTRQFLNVPDGTKHREAGASFLSELSSLENDLTRMEALQSPLGENDTKWVEERTTYWQDTLSTIEQSLLVVIPAEGQWQKLYTSIIDLCSTLAFVQEYMLGLKQKLLPSSASV
jgi:hypothetical protein